MTNIGEYDMKVRIYNLSENARVFKHGMNRSIYTAGSLLLFLRLCIIIPTKDDVGGIHRK